MKHVLRTVIVIGAPLLLTVVAAIHPKGAELHATVAHDANLWLIVHLLQLPLFGLVALSLHLLLGSNRGVAATLSRVGLGLFVIFYTALDTLAGIASGVLVRRAQELPASEHEVIVAQVEAFSADFGAPLADTGFPAFILTVLGGAGWILAVVAGAVALRRGGAPIVPSLLIGLSAVYVAHDAPSAPFAMAGLLIGVTLVEIHSRGWVAKMVVEP